MCFLIICKWVVSLFKCLEGLECPEYSEELIPHKCLEYSEELIPHKCPEYSEELIPHKCPEYSEELIPHKCPEFSIIDVNDEKTIVVTECENHKSCFSTNEKRLVTVSAVNDFFKSLGNVENNTPLFSFKDKGQLKMITHSSFVNALKQVLEVCGINSSAFNYPFIINKRSLSYFNSGSHLSILSVSGLETRVCYFPLISLWRYAGCFSLHTVHT
jgi:hypothetical protein